MSKTMKEKNRAAPALKKKIEVAILEEAIKETKAFEKILVADSKKEAIKETKAIERISKEAEKAAKKAAKKAAEKVIMIAERAAKKVIWLEEERKFQAQILLHNRLDQENLFKRDAEAMKKELAKVNNSK